MRDYLYDFVISCEYTITGKASPQSESKRKERVK